MKKNNDWKSYIGPIPTIAWESIREGINDYKYLYLLSEEINKSLNTKNTQLQKYVQRISYTLKELEKINKGRKNPLNPTNWNTEELEGIREWAANSIIKLRSFTGKTQKMDDRGLSDDETNDLKRKMSFRVVPLVDVSPHHRFWLTTPSFTSIPLVDRSPAIDGDLTDDAWKDASMISIPCSAKTTVRLMRDEKNFYFAWNCCEPYLKKLMPQSKNEDKGPIWIQDSVELFLAPFEKRKQCAHLMINHLGRMATECGHAKWQPLMINVATAKNKTGYTVELSLSIAELKALYPSDWTDFAINFCRVRTVNASLYDGCLNFNWAYATGGFHQPDKYGIAAYNNNVIIKNMKYQIESNKSITLLVTLLNRYPYPVKIRLHTPSKSKVLELNLARNDETLNGGSIVPPNSTKTFEKSLPFTNKPQNWCFKLGYLNNANSKRSRMFTIPSYQQISLFSLPKTNYILPKSRTITISPIIPTNLDLKYQISSDEFISPKKPVDVSNTIDVELDKWRVDNSCTLNIFCKNKNVFHTEIVVIRLP